MTAPALRHAATVPWRGEGRAWCRAAVFLVFVFIVLLWFWPLVHSISSAVPAGPGDAKNVIRGVWVVAHTHSTPFTFTRDVYNGAPEGYPTAPAIDIASPVEPLFLWGVGTVVGSVAAQNLFILLGFALTAFAGFLLAEAIGLGLVPSFIAGYVIAFNPWTFDRAEAGAAAFNHGWCLIVLIAALARLARRPSYRNAALAGLAYALCFLVAAYFGLLGGAFVIAYLLVEFFRSEAVREWPRILGRLGVMAVATALPLLPAVVAYASNHQSTIRSLSNPVSEATRFAAAPLSSYFLPAKGNPVIGWIGASLHTADPLHEKTLFFGYLTICLAVAGLVVAVRSPAGSRQRITLAIVGTAVPIAYLASLPTEVHLLGIGIKTPSYAVEQVTSFYRVYARFGYVVGIGLALLAAAALNRLATRRHGTIIVCAIGGLIAIELAPGAFHVSAAGPAPAYDAWLATQPRGIVAHYPMPTDKQVANQLAGAEYYRTRFTRQPVYAIFGAGIGGTREEAIRLLSRYITDPTTPGILAAEHVRYVVLHDDVYRAEGAAPPPAPSQLQLLRRFGDVRVYKLRASTAPVDLDQLLEQDAAEVAQIEGLPAPTVTLQDGFARSGATSWGLTGQGQLSLTTNGSDVQRAQLILQASSPGEPRTLDVLDAAGSIIGKYTIATTPTQVIIAPIALSPGGTVLRLTTETHAAHGPDLVLAQPSAQALADYLVSLRPSVSN